MSTESSVQLLAEGSGPKARTRKVSDPASVDASGNAQADDSRHQQVISLADGRGDLDRAEFQHEALGLLRGIADSLEAIRIAVS